MNPTVFSFLTLCALATVLQTVGQAKQLPNIILIVADDLGWSDLACYGSDLHESPHLDRLAMQGTLFTNAYSASPVCSPTRASILTGKHPARLQMTIWREAALSRGNRELWEPICLDSLPANETTFAERLRDIGYYNVHIGKWHVGRAEGYPQVHGFHQNIGGTLWGAPQTFWYPFNGDAYFSGWRYVPDLEPASEGDYLTDVLTSKALEVMESQAASARPFMLNLWYHSVHTPIEGKPQLVEYYQDKLTAQHTQRNPYYAAMVHSLDSNVGRILAKLDELEIADNTWVIFTSDNGGFVNTCKLHKDLQVANNRPLRSGKGSCYEGGIRVPLIVRTPQSPSAQLCREPVFSCDFFPTILAAVGLEPQETEGVDGESLQPLLDDPSATLGRDSLYFHYPHYYPTTTPVSAVRRGKWKLLEYYEDHRVELYDLEKDLGETKNLASEMPELASELRLQLDDWRKTVGALEPERNPALEPERNPALEPERNPNLEPERNPNLESERNPDQ